MLSVLCHIHSLRFAVPAAVMIGVAPQYISLWMVWKIVSAVFPKRIYHLGDEFLYNTYQSLVCFFFEAYTGAEVRLEKDCKFLYFVTIELNVDNWLIPNSVTSRRRDHSYLLKTISYGKMVHLGKNINIY